MLTGTMRSDLYSELTLVEDRHWWHQQKRHLVRQLINHYHPVPGKMLDVGCGGGKLLAELNHLGWQAEGVDAPEVKSLGQKRRLKITAVNLQADALPFPKNYFDLVICLDTLEHMENDRRLVNEMLRVVKPQGLIIISVPAYQFLFSYWDQMLGHFRRYNKKSLLRAIPKTKLTLKFMSYYFSYLLLPAIFIRLVKTISRRKQQSDFTVRPLPVFSQAVVSIFGLLESNWLKKFNLPLGLSLIGVWQKK